MNSASEEWMRRKKAIGCPCDVADSSQCKYVDFSKVNGYPCHCICHNVKSGATHERT
jgi:hypothetical protein